MRHIFITGATGFLGWKIVEHLLNDEDLRLYLLVRGKKKEHLSPSERIDTLIKKHHSYYEKNRLLKRIRIINGEVTEKNLGMPDKSLRQLAEKIDTIYHSAALCEFGVEWGKIKRINVDGTKNVLDFALRCKDNGRFKVFNHISTVAVAGKSGGVFYEDDLDKGQEFNNTYERSKFEAERLAHKYRRKGLNIAIFRPGIITGDSDTGDISSFQMPYQVLHILSLELFDQLPINRDIQYGLVPVDYVARAMSLISSEPNNKTYHLVNSNRISISFFLKEAVNYFGFKRPLLVSHRKFNNKLSGFNKRVIEAYSPYLLHKKIIFDTTNFDNAISTAGKGFRWPKIDRKFLRDIFRYCNKIEYIKRK